MNSYQLDSKVVDAADYFGTLVVSKFPSVELTFEIEHAWRPLWIIRINGDDVLMLEDEILGKSDYAKRIDNYCHELQERLFWMKDIFISYEIRREEPSNSNSQATSLSNS